MNRTCICWIVPTVLCVLSLAALPAIAQEAPKRSITEIGENLYRFQNNFHFSVFLVTEKGIIATDPINAEAGQWLQEQLAERFGQARQVSCLKS